MPILLCRKIIYEYIDDSEMGNNKLMYEDVLKTLIQRGVRELWKNIRKVEDRVQNV